MSDIAKPISLAAARREPVPEVVDELEQWLQLARKGDLRGVVIGGECTYEGDDETYFRFAKQNLDHMTAASLCEQHAFNMRSEIHETMTLADPVDVDEDEAEPDDES